ncbi:DMT family transporter [Caballeronia sordidicola]|uniref:Integral membrane protein n=1 Tax=Caballeronia sordidicola TaxID=196367 RepID=A0A226WLL3_CABSO|nr:DMT family transporter [Caballeronia sordidicola]OXC71699.1 Integral membrane protein [Caballeronia sordidicola]
MREKQLLLGISAAIFAAFAWSLNFIAPYVTGAYSIYDLAVCRFMMSGVLGLAILFALRGRGPRLTFVDWIVAAWLGLIGYVGYFLTIMIAVLYAGPIIPPAFVALVPVVLAIVANLGSRGIRWRSLALPLVLATTGLLLLNAANILHLAQRSAGSTRSIGIGIVFSIAAVSLWTLFGVSNEAALRSRPGMDARIWTALMMIAGSIEIVAFVPVGLSLGLFRFVQVGFDWNLFWPIFASALVLAAVGSIGGSWAWTIASQRLPLGLAGQLIATETIFATSFGLFAHRRWPTWSEVLGITVLLIGVVSAIRTFHRQSWTTPKHAGEVLVRVAENPEG